MTAQESETPPSLSEKARRTPKELSGAQWTNRYPGSTSLRDLRAPFRDRAEAFVDALRTAGAIVTIAATYRPPKRAYLMHWSWLIVKRKRDPLTVPSMDGVSINWGMKTQTENIPVKVQLPRQRQWSKPSVFKALALRLLCNLAIR
jgi:hypothetical protein